MGQYINLNGARVWMPSGMFIDKDGIVWCDSCQRKACQICTNCDCDGYPCKHKEIKEIDE